MNKNLAFDTLNMMDLFEAEIKELKLKTAESKRTIPKKKSKKKSSNK